MSRSDLFDIAYLKMAKEWSKLSYCNRLKVGALIVKNGMIISDGFNGTPSKSKPNVCEGDDGLTNWWVLHGEANAILKCAKNGVSSNGGTLYQTHSPCKECSKLILQSGISRVVYIDDYRDQSGVEFLLESGVEIKKLSIN
jgi:dCMP deaminase